MKPTRSTFGTINRSRLFGCRAPVERVPAEKALLRQQIQDGLDQYLAGGGEIEQYEQRKSSTRMYLPVDLGRWS